MKKFIISLSLLASAMAFTACSDFFDPETDDMLPGEEYISSDMEMYSGFLGILTKVQAIGDKELLLTETRGEFLDLTSQSSPEITALFNYVDDLRGNSYADPAPYYEVVIACNDYLAKMRSYRSFPGVDQEMWKNFVSCTIRFKAWIYKTIAEIYGEALWFDSPVTSLPELTEANGFQLLPVDQVMDRALTLMQTGWEGVASNRVVNFVEMFDPDKITSPRTSNYFLWGVSAIPYEGLMAELLLWKGAALDAKGASDVAQPYYQQCVDLVLNRLQQEFADPTTGLVKSDRTPWLVSAVNSSRWKELFSKRTEVDYYEVVSAILYDYEHDQTHSINRHFLTSGYNNYQLKPSDAAIDRWHDAAFTPGASVQDQRYDVTINDRGAQNYICKYSRVSNMISYDDVAIILYRATQYHFYLMEALNHLRRYTPVHHLLNTGMDNLVSKEADHEHDFLLDPQWAGFNSYWTNNNPGVTNSDGTLVRNTKNGNAGVRGTQKISAGDARKIIQNPVAEGYTHEQAIRHNDIQLLDECVLEFAAEGRNYAIMNRMALRYNDLSIVADLVCPKYEATGRASEIRAKILAGGNYVHYPLDLPN